MGKSLLVHVRENMPLNQFQLILFEGYRDGAKSDVLAALDRYNKSTGFRFFPYTGNNSDFQLDHENYLIFVYRP